MGKKSSIGFLNINVVKHDTMLSNNGFTFFDTQVSGFQRFFFISEFFLLLEWRWGGMEEWGCLEDLVCCFKCFLGSYRQVLFQKLSIRYLVFVTEPVYTKSCT